MWGRWHQRWRKVTRICAPWTEGTFHSRRQITLSVMTSWGLPAEVPHLTNGSFFLKTGQVPSQVFRLWGRWWRTFICWTIAVECSHRLLFDEFTIVHNQITLSLFIYFILSCCQLCFVPVRSHPCTQTHELGFRLWVQEVNLLSPDREGDAALPEAMEHIWEK